MDLTAGWVANNREEILTIRVKAENSIPKDAKVKFDDNNADMASYAIYAKSVDDLTFTNNTINYVGITNGTVVKNAVRIAPPTPWLP